MKMQTNLFWVLVLMMLTISLPSVVFAQKGKGRPVVKKPVSQPKTSQGTLAFNEGKRLFDQATAASYNSALQKYNEAIGHFERENNTEMLAETYLQMGRTHKRLNNFQESINTYGKAYQIFVKLGDNDGVADILNNTAVVFRDAGQFKDALENYQEALPLMRAKKDKRGEAQVLNGIGESMLGLGNANGGMSYLKQAVSIWQSLGASEDRVRTLFNLGKAYIELGDAQQGLNYCQQALSDSRQYNNPLLEGDILETLAWNYDKNGNLTKAIELRLQIFNAYRNSKASTVTPGRVLMSRNNLIVSYFRAGNFEEAFLNTNDGINYAIRNNESYVIGYLYGNLGVCYSEQGKFNEAINALNTGISIAGKNGDKYIQSFFLGELGRVYLEIDELDKAESYFTQAKQIMPTTKGLAEIAQGRVLSGLIRLYAYQGEQGKVAQYVNEGRSLGLDRGITQGSVQFLAAVAYSQLQAKKVRDSVQTFIQAFELANKTGHEVEKAKILYEGSIAYLDNGDAQTAIQMAQQSHDFFKRIGNDQMDMKTHLTMGDGFTKLGQGQQAMANYNSALDFAQRLNDQMSQILSLTGIATVYEQSRDYKSSIQYLNQALSIAQQTNVGEIQKFILDLMGSHYEKSGDKKKAKEFREKAKKIKN